MEIRLKMFGVQGFAKCPNKMNGRGMEHSDCEELYFLTKCKIEHVLRSFWITADDFKFSIISNHLLF